MQVNSFKLDILALFGTKLKEQNEVMATTLLVFGINRVATIYLM